MCAHFSLSLSLSLFVTQQENPVAAATSSPGLKLLIPNSQVGSIIGKAGSIIKELQEQSGGTRFHLYRCHTLPSSPSVSGPPHRWVYGLLSDDALIAHTDD
jgi:hypothetical protein